MNVTVIGTGYVGLVSGVSLAKVGHDVTCVDINKSIVDSLNNSIPTIFEKDLDQLLKDVIDKKMFRATSDLSSALEKSDIVIVAVGTPSENGEIDLSFISHAATQIGSFIKTTKKFISVIIKSTVIPSTTDTFIRSIIEESSNKKLGEFGLGMNPEFLREGEAIEDFMYPDRIVLGYEDEKTLELLEELYKPWDVEKIRVNSRTAEMIKYANNSILATLISISNEISNLASKLGRINSKEVMHAVHLDKRWNPIENGQRVRPTILNYLMPGCGFGGSCFPKDVEALRSQGEKNYLPMKILNSVLEVNYQQPGQVTRMLLNKNIDLKDKNILVLGLAFKPETDDIRESASIKIVNDLLDAGSKISVHDPIALHNFKLHLANRVSDIDYLEHWKENIKKYDIIIVATKWNEYFDLQEMDLSQQILVDARLMFNISDINAKQYFSIGYSYQ